MKNITLIAAIGKNYELGENNNLIWHLPEDLKFFKEQTSHKIIVMGKNTFDSLPKILPNRLHIVLTHQKLEATEKVKYFNTKEDLLKYIKKINQEVMIIGGSQIYKQFLNEAQKIILTEIQDSCFGNVVYFPKFDKIKWKRVELCSHEHKGIKYKHVLYEKLQK